MNVESVRFGISAIIFALLLLCIGLLCLGDIPPSNKELLMVIVGGISNMSALVVGYYFGSSEGSKRKTEIMNRD